MQYRKKPVVIEAVQFEKNENGVICLKDVKFENWPDWFSGAIARGEIRVHPVWPNRLQVVTLEDDPSAQEKSQIADEGDWIICGVAHELYPCKPDIFAESYEPA